MFSEYHKGGYTGFTHASQAIVSAYLEPKGLDDYQDLRMKKVRNQNHVTSMLKKKKKTDHSKGLTDHRYVVFCLGTPIPWRHSLGLI